MGIQTQLIKREKHKKKGLKSLVEFIKSKGITGDPKIRYLRSHLNSKGLKLHKSWEPKKGNTQFYDFWALLSLVKHPHNTWFNVL